MNLRSIRFLAEYALAWLALGVIPRLPRPVVVRLARVLGSMAAAFDRADRRVARANLDLVFGDAKSDREKRAIIKQSFQTFALTTLDIFWFARQPERRVREWVSFAPAFDRLFRPGAQICITAHMGNWEVFGMAFSLHGFPLASVAAPLANRRLDRLFLKLRKLTGQLILSKHGAVRGLLRTLKNGGKVALVLDQNTKPSDGGIFVDFFGLPAPVSTAVAALALRAEAELFSGVCIADSRGHYHAPAPSQITVTPGMDEVSLTQSVVAGLESLVRTHPEHWLWMYKRWKYIAPGCAPENYPFYAKPVSEKDRVVAAGAKE